MKSVFGFRVRLGNPDLDFQNLNFPSRTHPYNCSNISWQWESFTGTFLSNSRVDVREVKTESIKELSGYLRISFDMEFHLIVASIFLKTCVKDHGDSSGPSLERRIPFH